MNIIRKVAAYVALISVYSLTYLIAMVGGMIPRRSWKPTGRIMVIGRFDNPNWYLSHVTPLCLSGVSEIIMISDSPQSPLEKVTFVCPPIWISKLTGRACAKAIWMFVAAFRFRPDLYMGYHLMPAGCISLVVGKLFGRPSCYQMTGGPTEVVGGGYGAIDSFEGALQSPSRFIEFLALGVVRRFELIVVRGNKAKSFLQEHNVKANVAIITGSTTKSEQTGQVDRDIHLVFVGRLTHIKRLRTFISVVAEVRRCLKDTKAVIVGSGPLLTELRDYARELCLTDCIEFLGKRNNVVEVLNRSKVFLLTSQSEGLSIAMAEAMAAGVVPVVADVGELGDLVTHGVNGFLVEPKSIEQYTSNIVSLLQDSTIWDKCSLKAAESARKYCDIEVVTAKWSQHLNDVIFNASGSCESRALN